MCECGVAASSIGDFCIHFVKCLKTTAVPWYTKLKPWNEVQAWELQIGKQWTLPSAQDIYEVKLKCTRPVGIRSGVHTSGRQRASSAHVWWAHDLECTHLS